MTGTDAPIRLELDDGLAIVTLARGAAGNALNWALVDAFSDAAVRVAADPTVRAVLIRGEGKNFCVGGDLKAISAEADPAGFLGRLANRLHTGIAALAAGPSPVIVAVQGAAAGAGLSLVAAADVAIVGRSSSYSMAYSAIGLVADGGATWLLPRLIGLRRAQELAYLQRRLDATEAAAYGLVTRIVEDDVVQAEAETAARLIAAGPTQAYARLKRLFAGAFGATLEDQLAAEAQAIAEAMATQDAQGAVAAFLERRAPKFEGR